MAPIRLFSGPLSMFGAKAHIAALEKGLDVDLTLVPFTTDDRYHPKHADVSRINPKQQVPVLIHGDLEIFDSTQIFEYLEDLAPEPALWPAEPTGRARARQLEHRSDEIFFPDVVRLMSLQDAPRDPAAIAAQTAIAAYCQAMEDQIADGAYLAGAYTYADIAFFMAQLFAARMAAPMTDATPKLLAWRGRVAARPAVREALKPMIALLTAQNRPVPEFLITQ
jgi:glutathione S-transferase